VPSLVACAMEMCKFNREGQCDKSEIFIDNSNSCASFEPDLAAMAGGADPRAALLQMVAGGGGPPDPLGGGMTQPALPLGGLPPAQI